jgi:endonuclease YncB( thermonuclease family)
MTRYLARTCPKCKDYFGVVVTDPDEATKERPIDARCMRCGFKLVWRIVLGRKSLLSFSLILCFLLPPSVYPHGGSRDSYGCHHDRKRGDYHCHSGKFAGQHFRSKGEMLRGLKAGTPQSASLGGKKAEYRTVRRVVDGDTIIVGARERVRLIGVDTPETKRPNSPVEYYGKEATAFTKRMVEGKRVRLEFDQANAHIGHKDKYRRTLAYVFLEDGTFLNAEIIRQGYGFAYTRFPFKYRKKFKGLEREARQQRRGLWRKRRR